MNAKLNQQSFWPYHETWLIKTITRHNSPIYDECQSQSAKGFGHTTRRWDEGLTRSPFWGEHPTQHPGPGSGPHPGPGSGPHPGPGSRPGTTRAAKYTPSQTWSQLEPAPTPWDNRQEQLSSAYRHNFPTWSQLEPEPTPCENRQEQLSSAYRHNFPTWSQQEPEPMPWDHRQEQLSSAYRHNFPTWSQRKPEPTTWNKADSPLSRTTTSQPGSAQLSPLLRDQLTETAPEDGTKAAEAVDLAPKVNVNTARDEARTRIPQPTCITQDTVRQSHVGLGKHHFRKQPRKFKIHVVSATATEPTRAWRTTRHAGRHGPTTRLQKEAAMHNRGRGGRPGCRSQRGRGDRRFGHLRREN